MPVTPRLSRYSLLFFLAIVFIIFYGFPSRGGGDLPTAGSAVSHPHGSPPAAAAEPTAAPPSPSSFKLDDKNKDRIVMEKVTEVAAGFKSRMNATFVTLARNSDLGQIVDSIRQIEDRFNKNLHYDWIFLNDDDFDENFIQTTSKLVSGTVKYGKIPTEHWSYPPWIDQDRAARTREYMKDIIYGDSESYRHMCRFESGFFFRHPLLLEYEYYWRVEPEIGFFCDMPYDPFRFMIENNKKYSFVISLYEYEDTIPTLWNSASKFFMEYPEHIAANNSAGFVTDNGRTYNLCHFWSNFEIGSLEFFRSKPYLDFFNFLDKEGGFFYERWGDAPVHSIAAAFLLSRDELHFFDDVGYYHNPFTHCPNDEAKRKELRCSCNTENNFDWDGYSCLSRFFDATKVERPRGYAGVEPSHPMEGST